MSKLREFLFGKASPSNPRSEDATIAPIEQLAFEGPDGELTFDLTLDKIKSLTELGEDYWLCSAGYIGWITLVGTGFSTNFERPSLHIIIKEPFGIHLNYKIMDYKPYGKNTDLIVWSNTYPAEEMVEVSLGGEPCELPRNSFLTIEVALEVIRTFLEKQEMSDVVEWRKAVN